MYGLLIPTAPPIPPASLSATPSNGRVSLSWPSTPYATSYNVYRGTTPGGEGATPIQTGITSLSFTDTGLTNGQTYYYQVTGVDSLGEGGKSPEASVTPQSYLNASVTGSSSSATTAVNLTTTGTADWANWGQGGVPGFDHKATGNGQISTYTVVGSGTVSPYSNDPRSLSWSDGTPTASSSNNTSGVYISGIGNGFSITAPADTTQRTLTVYVGGWSSGGQLVAHFSDGSAANFTDTTATASGQYDRAYTLVYAANSANQTLTVTWVMASGTGNVTLNGAALAGGIAVQVPAAPTNLSAMAASGPQVNLSWADNSSNESGFLIDRALDSGFTQNLVTFQAPANATQTAMYVDQTVAVGTTYYYRVSATNSAGTSGPSNTANASIPTPPTTPSNASATLSTTTEIDLVWQDNATNEDGYKILRKTGTSGTFNQIVLLPANSTGYQDKGLSPGTLYDYHIVAYNIAGNADFAGVTESTVSAPPTGLTPMPGNGQVALTWTASAGAASYNIYRGTASGGESATPIQTGVTTTSYTDMGLNNGTTYYYQITAVDPSSVSPPNPGGESARSSEAFATPQVVIAGSLAGSSSSANTAANLTTTGIIDWAHWGRGGVPGLDHKATGGGLISSYTVVGSGTVSPYSNYPRPLSWSDGTPTATSSNNTSGGFIAGIGNGFSITAPADTTQRTLTVYVGGWNSGGRLVAHLSDGSAVDFTDTTATASGQYDRTYTLAYAAASANQTLTVTWAVASGTGNVTLDGAALAGPVQAPAAPATLSAMAGNTQVALTWTASTGATSYNIYRATASGAEVSYKTGVTGTSYTDSGLTNGTTYYYQVTVVNSGGESQRSSEMSATPQASIAGSLTGSSKLATTAVNLTTTGTTDWAHRGRGGVPGFDHKATGGGQISTYTVVGSAPCTLTPTILTR